MSWGGVRLRSVRCDLHRCEQEGQPHSHVCTVILWLCQRHWVWCSKPDLIIGRQPSPSWGKAEMGILSADTMCGKSEPSHGTPFLLPAPTPAPALPCRNYEMPPPYLGELRHNNPEACLGRIHFGRSFALKWCFSLANWMVYNTQVPVLFSSLWYIVAEEGPRAHLSFGRPGETSSYAKWWARFGELD